MNIIFFDIDGVLNHTHSCGAIDWNIVDRLIKMAEDTDSKLVMSSSWKDVFVHPENYSTPDRRFAEQVVEELGDLYIGATPDINDDLREVEIQAWLDENPDVDNFVILDDLEFSFKESFPDNFVHTSGFLQTGFTVENEQLAREILMREM